MYTWIHENSSKYSVALCCMALHVRREGYYDWLHRPSREARDAELVSALEKVRKVHPCYGVQSMLDELPKEEKVRYGKGYRVCRDNGLLTKRRKPKSLTQPDSKAQAAEDLVKRDFTSAAPNEKWLTDITELACKDGKLYLCAVFRYGAGKNRILHSDRGSQFTSHLYQKTHESKGFQHSMGRTGSCYDNARMESFFATLKKELIYRLPLYILTRTQVKSLVFDWIETYYNRKRRHTSNVGNLPPLCKRDAWSQQKLAA